MISGPQRGFAVGGAHRRAPNTRAARSVTKNNVFILYCLHYQQKHCFYIVRITLHKKYVFILYVFHYQQQCFYIVRITLQKTMFLYCTAYITKKNVFILYCLHYKKNIVFAWITCIYNTWLGTPGRAHPAGQTHRNKTKKTN